MRSQFINIFLVPLIVAIHIFILAYSSYINSPTIDEVAYLPAGLSHFQEGHYELAKVNPPLVRLVAAIPLLFLDVKTDWSEVTFDKTVRSEHKVGRRFVEINGSDIFVIFTQARLATIIFSLIGMYFCFYWAREFAGERAAVAAILMWSFSPTVIAYGSLITPDMGGIALGLASLYSFRRWLRDLTFKNCLLAGLWMGLAELARTTWVMLYPFYFVLIVIALCSSRSEPKVAGKYVKGFFFVCLLSFLLLNFGYGFQGSFARYGDYNFVSSFFGCKVEGSLFCLGDLIGNNFILPFPADYLYGMDNQRYQIEVGYSSFFLGERSQEGSWYYYLVGLLMKLTVGELLLFVFALSPLAFISARGNRRCDYYYLSSAIAIITIVVSSQTGLNHHVRYVYPILPLFVVLASRLFSDSLVAGRLRKSFFVTLLILSVTESITRYPHSLSFFNLLAGGPENGITLLDHSNLDWGQGLLQLKQWKEESGVEDLNLIYFGAVNPSAVGFKGNFYKSSYAFMYVNSEFPRNVDQLKEGYYAVSSQYLQYIMTRKFNHRDRDRLVSDLWSTKLRNLSPVAEIGYSISVYYLDRALIEDFKQKHGRT